MADCQESTSLVACVSVISDLRRRIVLKRLFPAHLPAIQKFKSARFNPERIAEYLIGVKTMLPNSKINSTVTIFAVVFSLLFAATAIAGKNKVTEPDDILTEEEVKGLMFMREEEKLARDSYLVLFEKWGSPIFDNISESEQRHMDAMKSLIVKYGLEDPVKDESVIGGYANSDLQELFDDLMERGEEPMTDALYVGALIEETDIKDIHHEIELAEQEDIISTYESLVCGSRNHLRAFVGQLDMNGAPYTPTVIPEEVFEAIINTPFERDCGTSVRKGKRPK